MLSKVLDEIICPCSKFNGTAVEVWGSISNFIPHFLINVNIYPRQWVPLSALPMCRVVLDIRTQTYGDTHTRVCVSLNNSTRNGVTNCGLEVQYIGINRSQHFALNGTKPLPETILTYHQSFPVPVTCEQFLNTALSHYLDQYWLIINLFLCQSLVSNFSRSAHFRRLHFYNCCHISQEPISNHENTKLHSKSSYLLLPQLIFMMTSSNGNIFHVTGHLCWEFTGPRWIPWIKASDAELWCLLWSAPE